MDKKVEVGPIVGVVRRVMKLQNSIGGILQVCTDIALLLMGFLSDHLPAPPSTAATHISKFV